jgi:hypothetical protein
VDAGGRVAPVLLHKQDDAAHFQLLALHVQLRIRQTCVDAGWDAKAG